jgi:hypothetical protein
MKLTTTVTLSKSLSVKRGKDEEGTEAVIAHLKFSDAFVTREEIDPLLGVALEQGVPWARNVLFDELGAPRARLEIAAPRREFTASIRFSGTGKDEMHIAGGTLTGITIVLDKSGGLLSGSLSWPVAGDELADVEPLLGQMVRAEMNLTDGEQGDLLRQAA